MSEGAAKLARELYHEHETGTRFRMLDESDGVRSEADAYAIQRSFVDMMKAELGEPIGYKVGLTSPCMQEMFGINTPVAGVILAKRARESGTALRISDYGTLGLEFEVGVWMGRDLGARPGQVTIREVSEAVSRVCAAIEIVDVRNADHNAMNAVSIIADNSCNAGIIVGDWSDTWPSLEEVRGVISLNGKEVGSGYGRDALGHPFASVTWLANHLAQFNEGLRAGDIVLTGSLIAPIFPQVAGEFRFELVGVGEVCFAVAE